MTVQQAIAAVITGCGPSRAEANLAIAQYRARPDAVPIDWNAETDQADPDLGEQALAGVRKEMLAVIDRVAPGAWYRGLFEEENT